jgi:hypothetical protein
MSEQPPAQPPPRPDDRGAIIGRLRIIAAVIILAVLAIGLALAGCSSSQGGSHGGLT